MFGIIAEEGGHSEMDVPYLDAEFEKALQTHLTMQEAGYGVQTINAAHADIRPCTGCIEGQTSA